MKLWRAASGLVLMGIMATWVLNSVHRLEDPGLPSQRAPAAALANPITLSVCDRFYETVCVKKDITRDPSGTVARDIEGEVQALRILDQVMQLHPDWTADQVREDAVEVLYPKKKRDRMMDVYKWVRRAMTKFIDHQPDDVFNAKQKKFLKQRIRQTELELPPPASVYSDEPELITKNDVFYERLSDGSTRMRVGGAYLLAAKSWFNLLFTVAHELGHSIDPCELRALGVHIPSYDRLGSCFQRTGLIAKGPERADCGPHDQLSETFADWMATQLTTEALRSFGTEFKGPQVLNAARNAVRDLCDQDESATETNTDFHPSAEVRIAHIYGYHPGIRQILGCPAIPASVEYCGF